MRSIRDCMNRQLNIGHSEINGKEFSGNHKEHRYKANHTELAYVV